MPTVTIDNVEYDLDKLSEEAKGNLAGIQFIDAELGRLQAKAATFQTARAGYFRALNELLPKAEDKADAKKKK
jgi:Family of unknown function (DUF6447)